MGLVPNPDGSGGCGLGRGDRTRPSHAWSPNPTGTSTRSWRGWPRPRRSVEPVSKSPLAISSTSRAGPSGESRKILLVAPMSGHYATLLRSTVISLLPEARFTSPTGTMPATSRSVRQIRHRGLHALSGRFHARPRPRHPCDRGLPAGPAGTCRDRLSGRGRPGRTARSLTLIGGPIDPDAKPRRHRFRPPRHDGPARRN